MPLYRRMFLKNGGILALWKIQETEEELLSKIFLSNQEKEELNTVKFFTSRLRWLASRLALRNLFDDPTRGRLKKDEHGKPYLSIPSGHISISHSGEMAAAIFHPLQNVGIDIELIRPKIVDIASKFMSGTELKFIQKENELYALFACWCAKEAIYKWYGKKGLSLKDGIAIRPFKYQREGTFEVQMGIPTCSIFRIHYEKIGEYMLAYVSD